MSASGGVFRGLRLLIHRVDTDRGNAIVEFVMLAIVIIIPLMYLVIAMSAWQRGLFGVTQAARNAGRAYATATDADSAGRRAAYAARLAMRDQGFSGDDIRIVYGGNGRHCRGGNDEPPRPIPGEVFAICVIHGLKIPGVPGFLTSSHNNVTGRFIVHLDHYRTFSSGSKKEAPRNSGANNSVGAKERSGKEQRHP